VRAVADEHREHWQDEPEEHDFPAAQDYLTLLLHEPEAEALVSRFRHAPQVVRKAKDLLRASGLALLPPDNPHVAKDLKKVEHGGLLSPVLLVRGRASESRPLVVADGYHRICASYHIDEDAAIPCRLVDLS
jgi:hypothetical protein